MKLKVKLFLMLAYIVGIVLAAFNTLYYINYVNPDNLLVNPSPITGVFAACCAVVVILITVIPYLLVKKTTIKAESKNSAFIIFCASLLGFLFAGYVFSAFFNPASSAFYGEVLTVTEPTSFDNMLKIIYYAGVVLAIPCAVYFIVLALQPMIRRSAKLCLLSIAPVLWCAVRLIYLFMQTSARVNVAGRKLGIVTLCLCIIFFLSEAKLHAPKATSAKSLKESASATRMYIASGCGAIVTLWISQIAVTLLQAFWIIEPVESYIINAIYITVILYITSRISAADFETVE